MRPWSPSLSSSSPFVRFFVAARSVSTASMASRPHYRGGRYRGYCDRSAVGDGENVAGDSHLNQGRGRGFNLGFRQVNGGGGYVDSRSYNYNNVSSNFQFNPRPPQFQQNRAPQFQHNRPPYFHQNQVYERRSFYCNYTVHMNVNMPPGSMMGGSYGGDRQGVYVNKQMGQPNNQFRPRNSKPLDFREWEYAKPEPPRHWERFTILSYNILADYLATEHWRKLYFHIPRHMLSWEWRKNNLFFELRLWSSDIMCFQEVDRFQDLQAELKRQGYDGIHKTRTGNPADGCSVFWRMSKFKLLHEESIEFNKLGLRDNVAQICVLELVEQNLTKNSSASDISSAGPNRVVVCNIHVLYNPKRGDIKLGQVRVLLDKANAVSKTWNNAPVVVCGDFNCTPKSPLYNYILEQKLHLSDLARDKVSGQASAEIQALIFQRPSPGIQASTHVQPSNTHVTLNSDAEKNDSYSDSQKHIITSGIVDYLQGQPQHAIADEPKGTRSSEGEPSSVTSGTVDDLQGQPQHAIVGEPKGTRSSEGEPSSITSRTGDADAFLGQSQHVNPDEPNRTRTSEGELTSITSGTLEDFQGHPQLVNADQQNGTRISEDKLSLGDDVQDVRNAIKNTPPSSTGPNITSLKSSKIEADIPYGGSLEEISLLKPDGVEKYIPQSAETTGHVTETGLMTSNAFASDASSCFENIYEEPTIFSGENEDIGEDGETFMLELTGESLHSDYSQFGTTNPVEEQQVHSLSPESEPSSPERTGYSTSSWTRTEIEAATGNGGCTSLEHPLQLSSTYSETEDLLGTRDGNGEPLVTSYNRCFCGTVDYIWRSEGLRTVKVLSPMQKQAMQWTAGFPTKKWGSDHIALVAQLAFVQGSQEGQRD